MADQSSTLRAAGPHYSTGQPDASESMTLKALLSADTNAILDLIDQLRQKGIKEEVPLPQIIVVGDQSSGKSSVLEAISRLTFPRASKLCTTFATEVALRRKPVSRVVASIEPAADRPEAERSSLRAWMPQSMDLSKFKEIVESAAKEIRKLGHGSKESYSRDVLRIEVSGPDYPQLTLVDLPGIIRRPNPNQAFDAPETCHNIVEGYIANPNSIILAILCAEREEALQSPLSFVEKHDPEGNRTVGVITKPDRAPDGEMEQAYIDYASNITFPLKHGWHVLKNRDVRSGEFSAEERDDAESSFFKSSSWMTLMPSQLGASSLRTALSTLLDSKIRENLPTIVSRIQGTLVKLNKDMALLGPSRTSVEDHITYLTKIAVKFGQCIVASVSGNNYHSQSLMDATGYFSLRAHIHILNDEFVDKLCNLDFAKMIMKPADDSAINDYLHSVRKFEIDQETFDIVARIHMTHRPASWQSGIVDRTHLSAVLFQRAAELWKPIADAHVQMVIKAVGLHISVIAENSAGKTLAQDLHIHHLDEALNKRGKELQQRVNEIFAPYDKTNVSTTRNPLWHAPLSELHASMHVAEQNKAQRDSKHDYELSIREAALRYMITLGTFIDNVNLLAVETTMLRDLENIFDGVEILNMDPAKLHNLAAEPLDIQNRRRVLSRKIVEFEDSLKICRMHAAATRNGVAARQVPATAAGHTSTSSPFASLPPLDPSPWSPSPVPGSLPRTPADVTFRIERNKAIPSDTGSPLPPSRNSRASSEQLTL